MKYYYPACTLDFTFENIFSTESISPPCFYGLRNFGLYYIYSIENLHTPDALALYTSPPAINLNSKNAEAVKFIIEIDATEIDNEALLFVDEGIFAYTKTIYFNKENFRFLFFSERDKRITQLKSESSLPTKGLKKYENNFGVIKDSELRTYNTSQLSKISISKDIINAQIRFDQSYNYLKGLLYGIVSGKLQSGSSEELAIRRRLKDITDGFAELKNRCEDLRDTSSDRREHKMAFVDLSLDKYIQQLNSAIAALEQLLQPLFPKELPTDEKIIEHFINKHIMELKSRDEGYMFFRMKLLNDRMLGTDEFSKFQALYLKESKSPNPYAFIGSMKKSSDDYVKASRYPNKWSSQNKDRANDTFKDAYFELERMIQGYILRSSSKSTIDLQGISLDYINHRMGLPTNFFELSSETISDFELVVRAILLNVKKGRGETNRYNLLNIIEIVGDAKLTKSSGRDTALYKYINNETTEFIDRSPTLVMKNFVAFVFNPDSLEKLQKYLENKEIEQKWMAYAFWCCFNGFANISRNFLRSIFDSDNEQLQSKIDNLLTLSRQSVDVSQIKEIGARSYESIEEHRKEQQNSSTNNKGIEEVTTEDYLPQWFIAFYFKTIHSKYKIDQTQLYQLLSDGEEEYVLTKLKELGVPKKAGRQILKSYNSAKGTLFN